MDAASRSETVKRWNRDALGWAASKSGRRVAALLLLLLVGQFAIAVYETRWLGLPLLREEPAGFAVYQQIQMLFVAGLSALLVTALVTARARPNALDREPIARLALAAGLVSLAAAAAGTIYFLADPAGFHGFAQEDRPLEWASALLLLGAGGCLAVHAFRSRGEQLMAAAAGALALVLVVIGMEEISWGQRLFGFATPERLAELNWQAEFNLHNVQTDLSETLYYGGAGLFLIVLPLLRDLLPTAVAAHPWLALAPRRGVVLVSAPIAIFNFGHWNLLPIQLTVMLAFCALLAWSRAAASRGDRKESRAFLSAAGAVLVGQALFLAYGPAMLDLPDATEYKEFFLALGFAWYAAGVVTAGRGVRA
jgi:hypothetical protein